MKRVVVTGIGIVSSLGNNCREVLESLRQLKSGIAFDGSYREMGLQNRHQRAYRPQNPALYG